MVQGLKVIILIYSWHNISLGTYNIPYDVALFSLCISSRDTFAVSQNSIYAVILNVKKGSFFAHIICKAGLNSAFDENVLVWPSSSALIAFKIPFCTCTEDCKPMLIK